MKKTYVKPTVYLESFRLSDAIAGNCDLDVGFSDTAPTDNCKTKAPGFNNEFLFLTTAPDSPCTVDWFQISDSGCYHEPIGSNKYFGS